VGVETHASDEEVRGTKAIFQPLARPRYESQAKLNETDRRVLDDLLKLKIGEYDIPERCLRSVILYPELSTVEFAGVFVGEKDLQLIAGLRRLAEMRAIAFEAVDRNGVRTEGLCDIKNLRFDEDSTTTIKFSGRLVRPFQD
jgi:hypothetical protein